MAALKTTDILRFHNLRPTPGRREILDLIRHSACALTSPEIEEGLSIRLDRITTYGTLQSFKKKGIVHSIVDPHSGTTKYIFNDGKLPPHHAHFKCMGCGTVECLNGGAERTEVPSMPSQYSVVHCSFIIEGLCPTCRN